MVNRQVFNIGLVTGVAVFSWDKTVRQQLVRLDSQVRIDTVVSLQFIKR